MDPFSSHDESKASGKMVSINEVDMHRNTWMRRIAYSSATLSLVTGTVLVLGAPLKWSVVLGL